MKSAAALLLALAGSALAATQQELFEFALTAQLASAQDCELNAEGCVANADFWSTVETEAWPSRSFLLDVSREIYPEFTLGGCLDHGFSRYLSDVVNRSAARFFTDTSCYFLPEEDPNVPCFNGVPDFLSQGSNQLYMQQASSTGLPCQVVAKEYISANLNLCNGACADSQIIDDLTYLVPYMYEKCAPLTPDIMPNTTEWEAVLRLRRYNNGELMPFTNTTCTAVFGAAACPMIPINTTEYSCVQQPACPTPYECDGGCTEKMSTWRGRRYRKKANTAWSDYCSDAFRDDWADYGTCNTKDAYDNTILECRAGFVRPGGSAPTCPSGSDKSLVDVMRTNPVDGQACYRAGRQMIAAELNAGCHETNACMPTEIRTTLDAMWDIVEEHCQCLGQSSNLNGLDKNVVNETQKARFDLLRYKNIIRGYNIGNFGPGTCDEVLAIAAPLSSADAEKLVQVHWTNWVVFALAILIFIGLVCLIVLYMTNTSNSNSAKTMTGNAFGYARMRGAPYNKNGYQS